MFKLCKSIVKASSLLLVITIAVSLIALLAFNIVSATINVSSSGVKIIKGPSPILDAEATSVEDVTLMNEYLAVSFGIGTPPPWGVPTGNIIDAAVVVNGKPDVDVLAQFSFLVNGWGRWAKIVSFEIVENTTERGVIRVTGYWGNVRMETIYILEAGKNYLYVKTKLTNEGDKPVKLVSGYAISFERGWTFTPGFGTGRQYKPKPLEEAGVIDDWVSGYHEDFVIGFWAPYFTHLSTSISWVDPLTIHVLEPGETEVFEGYMIFVPIGSTGKVLETIIELKGLSYGVISGTVKTVNGEIVEKPIVIVEKDGKPYCWVVGSNGVYEVKLPPGTYTLYAIAKGYGPSSKTTVNVKADTRVSVDFKDVTPPGKVVVKVVKSGGKPVDAKILIRGGPEIIVYYLRVPTVYTDFENIGVAEFTLAPGTYTLIVSHGGGFISKPVVLKDVTIKPNSIVRFNVTIDILIEPRKLGWYCADLHHHSDILDGRTPPKYLVLAQSAAALDFVFVSDHDSVARHYEIAKWAKLRNMPFIPSVEVSPPWGHFNPYPIPLGKDILYRGTAREIFKAAREAGAIVIRVNHPYTTSGYFRSQERNEIPGGYCEDWDVAEINGKWDRTDNKTLTKMWELWNLGLKYYLSAGSDVHDVWATPYTGSPRVYAYIPGEPTPEAFAYAEKNGHSFITYGPLIFTNPIPGTTIATNGKGNITINIRVFAVDGVQRMIIVSRGVRLVDLRFPDKPMEITYTLNIPARKLLGGNTFSWISVMVWDSDNDLAITNPIWVSMNIVKPVVTVTKTETITKTRTVRTVETVTQLRTVTTTKTETTTETITKTETVTTKLTETTTKTITTTVQVEVEKVRWDIVAALAIVALVVGAALAYTVLTRKRIS
ncbi:MAG TPA: hypothetical protein EYH40_04510 [Desulfurococcales archaeon]|nr:hypothetical protein [Desulfurococcales archaeon]